MKQLPLPIRLDERATLENYVAGPDQPVVKCLDRLFSDLPEQQVFIWCKERRGKTHLLQALCNQAARLGKHSAYLPMRQFASYSTELLLSLERLDIVCVDDIHMVTGNAGWSEALFYLVNRCRSAGCTLVLSASENPQTLATALPDLQSRLVWGPVFHLKPLGETDLRKFITRHVDERGLEMPDDVITLLLQRTRRDAGNLLELIDRLDEEALAQKRRITAPFARQVLGL